MGGHWNWFCRMALLYRDYSKVRTHNAIEPYNRSMPRSIGPAYGVVRVLNFE